MCIRLTDMVSQRHEIRCQARYRERSMSLSGQEAMISKLWLANEQVNIAHHSSTLNYYPKDITMCHGPHTKHLLKVTWIKPRPQVRDEDVEITFVVVQAPKGLLGLTATDSWIQVLRYQAPTRMVRFISVSNRGVDFLKGKRIQR